MIANTVTIFLDLRSSLHVWYELCNLRVRNSSTLCSLCTAAALRRSSRGPERRETMTPVIQRITYASPEQPIDMNPGAVSTEL